MIVVNVPLNLITNFLFNKDFNVEVNISSLNKCFAVFGLFLMQVMTLGKENHVHKEIFPTDIAIVWPRTLAN